VKKSRIALLLGCSSLAFSLTGVPFAAVAESQLLVEGRIREVMAMDLDGDSLRDLVVLSVSGHSTKAKRRVSVFWQRARRKFREQPDTVWDLDPSITALDLFADPTRPEEESPLYSLRSDGVYLHHFHRDGRIDSRQILQASLPHLIPANESVAVFDFVAAWSGREQEILVPDFPHPRLFRFQGGSSSDSVALSTSPVASYRSSPSTLGMATSTLNTSYSFSTPVSADQDGDDRKEIVFVERNRVTVFDSIRQASLQDSPAKRVYPVRLLTDEEASSDRYSIRSQLVDLDGNGRLDLVTAVYRGTAVLELTGRIMIFRARPDGSFERDADQVLQLDDALYNMTQVLDLDGDGTKEIVVPSAKIGLWGYLRLLTTRKTSFSFNTLSLGPEGRFDPGKVIRDSMTVRLSQSYDLPVVALADTCGDGLLDLVIGRGEDQVCIHDDDPQQARRRFTPRPRSCFKTDPYARFLHADMDGDRKEELIRYGTMGEERSRVVLTFLEDCSDRRN